MTTNGNNNLTNPDLWFRLLYMILFGLLSWLARLAVLVIALLQFLLVLFTGSANANLRCVGQGIARWTDQAYQFLTFAADEKPYPFQDWPVPLCDAAAAAESAPAAPAAVVVTPAPEKSAEVEVKTDQPALVPETEPSAAEAPQTDSADPDKPKVD